MAKKIRFPLKMKNGAEVRSLEELKENFDLESVLSYFMDGKLVTWLADRYYDEKAAAVAALSTDMSDLNVKLCEILEVEYQAETDKTDLKAIQRQSEKFKILSSVTDNSEILNNVDIVAISQDELFDILDEHPEKVYLYGEKFSIPFGAKNVCYIGVNNPVITIDKTKYVFEYNKAGISFKNVRYEDTANPYVTIGEKLFLEGKYQEAFPFIEQAANNGNPRAMYILACYYNDGYEVVKQNVKERNNWCVRAYTYKEPLSMYSYAKWCLNYNSDEEKNIYASIFEDIQLLSESGDILAQVIIIYMYRMGYGIEQDEAKAFNWCKKAAEQGYAEAQHSLGYMYFHGYGVEEDKNTGVEWYRKAAEQGHLDAQLSMGYCYYNGYGVKQNKSISFEWYIKAAKQGNFTAQCYIGDMYINGDGIGRDYNKAIEWYRKAAEQGSIHAINTLKNLGVSI